MRFFLLTLLCCIIYSPVVSAFAADASVDLLVTPTAAPAAAEAAADGRPLESNDAASTELPEDNENDDAAPQDTPTTVVIDLTDIMLRLDSIVGTLTQLWQHVRFWAVAAFAWWFAKKSFRGVS